VDVETHNGVDPVAREWEGLADERGAPPWLRPEWVAAWFRAFGSGELEILVLRRAGRAVAVLPLLRRGSVLAAPTNWHTPDFRLVAADEEAKRALLSTVFSARRRRVTLGFLDEADAAAVRRAAEAGGYRVLSRTLERPPFVRTVGLFDDFERTLGRHAVSEMRRRRRRISEQGELKFEVADGRERLDQLLEEGFRVEASGWKGEAGTAIISSEETRRYYTEVARLCAARGWLGLAFLRLDERPIAFQFLVRYGGVVSQLKGGFDEEFRKLAPGTLLLQDVIRYTFEGETEMYEFLGAEERFKLEWAAGTHDRKLVQAFAPSLAGHADRVAFTYGRPLAKRGRALIRR